MSDLITTTDAARILKVSQGRIRHLIAAGVLNSQKTGRDHLLNEDEVREFSNRRRPAGRPGKGNFTVYSQNPFRKSGCLKQKYHWGADQRFIYGSIRYRGAIRSAQALKPTGEPWSLADKPKI